MSDMPKGLRTVASYRWVLLTIALLLTVVALLLGWLEVQYDNSPTPRAFVWGTAMVVWVTWVLLSCTVCAVRVVIKAVQRANERLRVQIIEAICERRMEILADLMEEGGGNVRSIDGRR